MANRYVAFGYEITDGVIAIIESERKIVERIFGLYVDGKSLAEIAERMNSAGVSYNNDGREWNKNIVKRMLENRKYLGEHGYPAIIDQKMFEQARKIREKKFSPLTEEQKAVNRFLHSWMLCGRCGNPLTRYRGSSKAKLVNHYWKCENPECTGNNPVINEQKLLDKILGITNDLIENYEKVEEGKEPELEPEPDTTELRLMNEIRSELSDQRMELQSILEKICGIAEARFARCEEMDYRAINQMIKRELSLCPRSETVNPSLLKTITKRIQIYPDRSISIELINGYTAREVTMCVHASTGSISAN